MMNLLKSLGLTAIAGLMLVANCWAAELTDDSLPQIKDKIEDEKAVLVDVREKREWDAGHIDGAIFLPLSEIRRGVTQEDLKRLPKDKVLYLHCAVGKRAMTAGAILKKYGYEVQPMKPGYREMIEAGFPKAKESR